MSLLSAVAPALPLHEAGKYVAGAFVVFVAILLIYVAIMARRLGRMRREMDELNAALDLRQHGADASEEPTPIAEPR